MDLAKAFFFLQLSCAGAKENGKEEQVLPALFGNFNLDSESFYLFWRERSRRRLILCFAKFKASQFAHADSFQNNRFQCGR